VLNQQSLRVFKKISNIVGDTNVTIKPNLIGRLTKNCVQNTVQFPGARTLSTTKYRLFWSNYFSEPAYKMLEFPEDVH